MAILTISGEPASHWEEIAQGSAKLLQFELITEIRLNQCLAEEFGTHEIPSRAWSSAAMSIVARMAARHHLVVAFDGAERLLNAVPQSFRVRIAASAARRAGNLMIQQGLEKSEAMAMLRQLDLEQKRGRRARFKKLGRSLEEFDLVLNTEHLDASRATEMIAAIASAAKLPEQGFLPTGTIDEIQFNVRMELARHGISPAKPTDLKRAPFNHPSEEMFGNLLDFYRIPWEYEPRSFPLQWDKDGNVTEAFTPDFYLPESDLYVELTTMKQSLVTKKNRKIKLLRTIYPHIQIQIFYQKDFQDFVFKYGLKAVGS